MRRIPSWVANLALALASLALTVLVIEVAARAVAEGRARSVERSAVPLSRYHPLLGWDKVPGAEQHVVRPEFDITLRFNAKGLRGPDLPYEKPAGVRRVLLLGDSFTEGYYVEEQDTVRAVLEGLLNAAGCGRFEVVNGGTIAYSTDQEYLFYTSEGRRYQPDLVLLLFYYNDLYYNASPTGPGGEPKPYFVVEDGAAVLRNSPVPPPAEGRGLSRQNPGASRLRPWHGSIALRMLSNRTVDGSPALHRFLARLGLVEPVSPDPPREMWPYGPGNRGEVQDMWARTEAILRALERDVTADHARLAVLYIPVRFEVNDTVWEATRSRYNWGRRWDRTAVFDRLRDVCTRLSLPLIDPRGALRRAEATATPAYYDRDVHWTAVGNAVAAHALDAWAGPALGCPR